jgi:hypothetical protein
MCLDLKNIKIMVKKIKETIIYLIKNLIDQITPKILEKIVLIIIINKMIIK